MQELPFLHSARRLMLIDICMKFRQDSLRGFQVTERTRFVTDRQTDGQTDGRTDDRGKTICLPTLKGGDIIKTYFSQRPLGHFKLNFVCKLLGTWKMKIY